MFFKRYFSFIFIFFRFRTSIYAFFHLRYFSFFRFRTFICVSNEKRRTKTKKTKSNEKKCLKRRIFYRLQTSADVKRHQKASADVV